MAESRGIAGTPSLLRSLNDRSTARLLFEHGVLSKTELGAVSGLSKPTVSHSLQRLTELGLVTTCGSRAGRPGPAAQLYELERTSGYGIAVDIANDAVRASIAGTDGIQLAELELRPEGDDVLEVITRLYRTLIDRVLTTSRTTVVVVVGISGAYDDQADLVRHGSHLSRLVTGLEDPGLQRRLSAKVPAQVTIENDVKLVALAESGIGASVGVQNSVLLWAEGGVGTAAVLAGRLHRGATGAAGEVGFLPVPGSGPTRGDNPRGGFQHWVGGAALEALARHHDLAGPPEQVIAAEVARGATRPDGFLAEVASRYATGIAAITAVLDPEIVVFSGKYAVAGRQLLADLVSEAVGIQAMRPVPVVIGELVEAPVLTGAAYLARRRLREHLFERVGPVE